MVDDSPRALALGFEPTPDVPTLQLPILYRDEMPLVEPRRWTPTGPVWDATDEIYITYDREGNRALVTTGPNDIWNREHSYQRTGSARYEALRRLGDSGGRAGGTVRRPSWARGTGEWPEVRADRDRDYAGPGPLGGAGGRATPGGDGAPRTHRHARDRADGGSVPERSAIRSHRHCPGCTGHEHAGRSGGELLLRVIVAWAIGWAGVYVSGVNLDLVQYLGLTSFLALVVILLRPVWREFAVTTEQTTKGGRR